MEALWVILALVIGLALGALIGWLVASRKAGPGADTQALAEAPQGGGG